MTLSRPSWCSVQIVAVRDNKHEIRVRTLPVATLEDAIQAQPVSMLSGWVQQNSCRPCCCRDGAGLIHHGLLAAVLLL